VSEYPKPHRTYDEQLKILADRGLHYADRPAAIRALKAIGYYRLSAYTYPLRKPGPPTTDGSRPPRADEFVDGASFDDVLTLYKFDNALRTLLVEGLQQIEVGMRVRIGHQLGRTDKFGHLDEQFLDRSRCGQPSRFGGSGTAYDSWLDQFDGLADAARNEEYVKHFLMKYNGKMPIWVATEVMTFGCLTALYALLTKRDADKIAESIEIKDRDVVHGYMKSLNVLRNHCAHNARIWNRSTVYPPKRPPKIKTNPRIHHLNGADPDKLYFLATLCAEFVIELNPESNWPRQFRTLMNKHFQVVHGMTEYKSMGFVQGWKDEDIWNYEPVKTPKATS
jgi:abortive infection bacteriophage resistance protein